MYLYISQLVDCNEYLYEYFNNPPPPPNCFSLYVFLVTLVYFKLQIRTFIIVFLFVYIINKTA